MRVSSWRLALCAGVAIIVLAGAGDAALGAAPSIAAANGQIQTINHLSPRPDSRGPQPKRLEWTAVDGADSYTVGIWNEVDVLIWRQNGISTTSVTRPDDVSLEPGTYFWSVSALRNGEELADSGLSAFVVRTSP